MADEVGADHSELDARGEHVHRVHLQRLESDQRPVRRMQACRLNGFAIAGGDLSGVSLAKAQLGGADLTAVGLHGARVDVDQAAELARAFGVLVG